MTALDRKQILSWLVRITGFTLIINQLVLNITKTNVIKFAPKTTTHNPLDIYYKDNVINEVKSTKLLGMHIDNHMNWKPHVEQIL